MIQNMNPRAIKTIEIKELLYQFMSLRHITKAWKCFDIIKEHIKDPNFEIYLSGEYGVSNVALVLCFLMGEESVEKMNLDFKNFAFQTTSRVTSEPNRFYYLRSSIFLSITTERPGDLTLGHMVKMENIEWKSIAFREQLLEIDFTNTAQSPSIIYRAGLVGNDLLFKFDSRAEG